MARRDSLAALALAATQLTVIERELARWREEHYATWSHEQGWCNSRCAEISPTSQRQQCPACGRQVHDRPRSASALVREELAPCELRRGQWRRRYALAVRDTLPDAWRRTTPADVLPAEGAE
jgi:hypothetical protein